MMSRNIDRHSQKSSAHPDQRAPGRRNPARASSVSREKEVMLCEKCAIHVWGLPETLIHPQLFQGDALIVKHAKNVVVRNDKHQGIRKGSFSENHRGLCGRAG